MWIYDLPEMYDIAFSWDVSGEIAFFKTVFEHAVPHPVERILEPACGSGRFLRTLPAHGFRVTGYDINPAMARYAGQSVHRAGYTDAVDVVLADMASAAFSPAFDVALNSINSFRYLLSDADVEAHLERTAASLRDGGVYIVHMNFAYDGDFPLDDPGTWLMERNGRRVTTTWETLDEDHDAKRSLERATFVVETNGKLECFREPHTLRLWFYEDLVDRVDRSRVFEIAKVYGEDFEAWDSGRRPSGPDGSVYVLLRKVA